MNNMLDCAKYASHYRCSVTCNRFEFVYKILKLRIFKILFFVTCLFYFPACVKLNENKFDHEVVYVSTYNPDNRIKNIKLLNDIVIERVEFCHASLYEAVDSLARSGHQSISCIDFPVNNCFPTTNRTINISMTNASFLEVLEKICEQSERYWGFNGNILITMPIEYVQKNYEWKLKSD